MSERGRPNERRVIEERWTATIKVKSYTKTQVANNGGYFDNPPVGDVHEYMDLEITAPSLAKLQEKVTAHVNLIEELE